MPVADLLDGQHHFIIPSFQRGYRWEEKQVTDLLQDIKQFADDSKPRGNSYFLQPVVVKPVKKGEETHYEVLDGQQRLTTLLLLLKRIMRNLPEDERAEHEGSLYDITYANRPQLDFDNPKPEENIDSFYLSEAKRVIDEWFANQIKQKRNLSNFRASLLYRHERQVKIIWYAISDGSEDLVSINIFNRLNKGKISLTSSELIKALFIMDYDLRAGGDKLPAEQLAMEWNEMERRFQDDNFWYFISDDSKGSQTRIDVLFDFVTLSGEDKDGDFSYREFQRLYDFCRERERRASSEDAPSHPEEEFQADWAKGIRDMRDAWRLIRKTFDRLVAWYEDNLYYHYVGYLVAVGFSPLDIFNRLEDAKRERRDAEPIYEWTIEDTQLALRKMMMERFKQDNRYIVKDAIEEFEYGSEHVARILLLFNIESCRIGNNIRFAFDKYKKGKWDVEHIDSQNDATLQEYDDRMRWLRNVSFILRLEHNERAEALAKECEDMIKKFGDKKKVTVSHYQDFYFRVNQFYSAESGEDYDKVDLTAKKKDFLSNLTLLDSATNREYKDAPFAYKRHCIVSYDRKGDRFIPLCTRNLFLKYFTDSNNESSHLDNLRWNEADRLGYLRAIHEAVDPIFDSVKEPKAKSEAENEM